MITDQSYNYTPLPEPIPISEQKWPEGTIPLVATGTLTYNHEPYIRKCLDGILMQKTTFPVRVTIFEDASTDRTAKIVKEYADKYPGLIFAFCQEENTYRKGEIRRKALEPYREARNVAKYIALCEGDDYWTDPMKLQKQVEFMEDNLDYSLCFHDALMIHDNVEGGDRPFVQADESREYTGDEILKKWTIPTASVIYRMSMYERNTHPDFLFGDIVLFLTMAKNGRLWGMKEIMSVYRRHEGGVTAANHQNSEMFKRLLLHYKAIATSFDGIHEKTIRKLLGERYTFLGLRELKRANINGVESLAKGFIYNPTMFLGNIFNFLLKKLNSIFKQ